MAYDTIKLIDKLVPDVRRAFLTAVQDIKRSAQLGIVSGHIERGNIEAALLALNIRPEFFAPLDDVLKSAYLQGGREALAGLPAIPDPFSGGRVVARFNGRNPRAEAWLAEQSSRLITGPAGMMNEIRESIRGVLRTGMQAGRGPRSVALDIVGQLNLATGAREGGIIGLTSGQKEAAQTALAELRSGDPAAMQAYMRRKLREKQFDPIVRRAIRDGKPVSAKDAAKMAGRYSDRMLDWRGETIARTELLGSLHAAQNEGMQQLIDDGKLTDRQITNIWDAANDADTRESHRFMANQRRRRGVPFTTGAGYSMNYPGDRSLDAPAEEIINCRCRIVIDIDFISELKPGD